MADRKISVVLVDDHDIVRQGAQAFLSSYPEFEIVGEAASGQQAIEIIPKLKPNVAVVDLSMPGMDGVRTIREIKRIYPQVKIVVLTSYDSDDYIFSAIKAGAISYLLKSAPMTQLAEAVRQAMQDESIINPKIAARLVQEVREQASVVPAAFRDLTEREIDVLILLAYAKTNAEIAAHFVITENTVKGYISNILGKLHIANRTEAAVLAWQEGLVSQGDA